MLKWEDGGGRILKIAEEKTITKLCESKENRSRKLVSFSYLSSTTRHM